MRKTGAEGAGRRQKATKDIALDSKRRRAAEASAQEGGRPGKGRRRRASAQGKPRNADLRAGRLVMRQSEAGWSRAVSGECSTIFFFFLRVFFRKGIVELESVDSLPIGELKVSFRFGVFFSLSLCGYFYFGLFVFWVRMHERIYVSKLVFKNCKECNCFQRMSFLKSYFRFAVGYNQTQIQYRF